MFAFLSLTWGIISDIDIESERFRMLGNARFTAGAVSRILTLRIYGGKLSFLPSTNINENVEECSLSDDETSEKSCEYDEETIFHTPHSSSEALDNGELNRGALNEESAEIHKQRSFSTTGIKYLKTDRLVNTFKHVSLGNVPGDFETPGRSVDVMSAEGETSQARTASVFKRGFSTSDFEYRAVSDKHLVNGVYRSNERPVKGPADRELVPLSQDLPEGWVTIDGEFVTVMVLLISHLGSNLYSCPGLELGDGEMWLLFIEKGISRKSLIDVLTKMETGEHVKNSDIKIHKIQGFRLEPKFERSGYIAVDGEVIEYEAVQGQVHRGLGRVFACH